VIVPDCGHFIMEEAAQAFIAELLPFLQRTR
jgi:pimeloyl-ACP methyl ester carboxylesterase